jgi:trimeric autotransporter adhesin
MVAADLGGTDLAGADGAISSALDMAGDLAGNDLAMPSPTPTPSPIPPVVNFDHDVEVMLLAGNAWYFGGEFTRTQVIPAGDLLAIDSADNPVGACALGDGFDGRVDAVVQTGSALYVGGAFSRYRGKVAKAIAKLDATTCALDTNFSPQLPANGFNGQVHALATDGTSLFVGGAFTAYRGVANSANNLAKLALGDGTLSPLFGPAGATSNGLDGQVLALTVVGSYLFAGGAFARYQGVTGSASNLARISLGDGSLDTSFSPNGANGFNSTVQALATDAPPSPSPTPSPGPYLYVGGFFTHYNDGGGASANHLAKLDMSGALDGNFSPSTNGVDGPVTSLAVSGSSLYVGGSFTQYRGVPASASNLAKLAISDGTLDATFSPVGGNNNGFDSTVTALAISGSTLYVGGVFVAYRGVGGLNNLASLDAGSGALKSALLPTGHAVSGVNSEVDAICVAGGTIFIGGTFSAYGGQPANHIARFVDGALDPVFTGGSSGGFNARVRALVASGSSIYVGGDFGTYYGIDDSADCLAKLDLVSGAIDTHFSPVGPNQNGFDGTVYALLTNGSSLYVGGAFTAYRGVAGSANNLTKLDLTSGDLDQGFSPPGGTSNGVNDTVYALAVAPMPSPGLIVGGRFGTLYTGGAQPANAIAKVRLADCVLDNNFSPATNGFDGAVHVLAVAGDALYAGGTFSAYRGVAGSASNLAKLSATTGELDTTFGPPGAGNNGTDAQVVALLVSDGALYIGGSFQSYRSVPSSAFCIARLDPSSGALDPSFSPPGAELNGFNPACFVEALASFAPFVEVGGIFTRYRGTPVLSAARLDESSGAAR